MDYSLGCVDLRREKRSWFTYDSTWYAESIQSRHLKQFSHIPGRPWNVTKKISLSSGKIFSIAHVFVFVLLCFHFPYNGRCPDIQMSMNSWAIVINLAEWQKWRRNTIGKSVTRSSRKQVYDYISSNGHWVWKYLCPLSLLITRNINRRCLDIWDERAHSVDVSHCLSLITPSLAQFCEEKQPWGTPEWLIG